MTSRAELRQLISEYELDAYTDDIMDVAQPAIRINRTRMADDSMIAIGTSKLGGSPDVPPDFIWPEWNDIPLTFLAQIRLADIAAFDIENALPHTGHLYFFYETDEQPWGFDPKERGFFQVLYIADELQPLNRSPHPVLLDEYRDSGAFAACAVSFSAQLTLPVLHYYERQAGSMIPLDIPAELTMSDIEHDRYWDLHTKLTSEEPRHRLLGFPDTIQGDMRAECQFVTHGVYMGGGSLSPSIRKELEPDIPDWRLLLQIDTDDGDDGFGGIWGDAGMLYFWIRNQDLAARDFSKSWMILQCG